MSSVLAPPRGHQEADKGDSKADQNVPLPQRSYWERCLGDVEDDDPHETEEHEAKHHWLVPNGIWASLGVARLTGLGCA